MGQPAVFLDRDGTLIEDTGYLRDPAQIRLIPGTIEALRALADAGFARVVVTNQSGIGRGLISGLAYRAVADRLDQILEEAGVSLTATYMCPHRPDAGCACRKPGIALYEEAIQTRGLSPEASWWVGDRPGDLLAAQRFGGRSALVLTGEGASHLGDPQLQAIPTRSTLLAVVRELILSPVAYQPGR